MVNIGKLVDFEIQRIDEESVKFYKQYLNNKLSFAEYSLLRDKCFIEINLLRELKDKYE